MPNKPLWSSEIVHAGDLSAESGLGYDAFLSYSTALDGRLAPALQRAVERYAKPWHKLRSCRVFRDSTNLNVSPDLWHGIEVALDDAPRLILLASPEAAMSKWVRKEVEHWLSRHRPSGLLLVLTDGEIAWDDGKADFDWRKTTALPRSLAGVLREEPLYVDMRWARNPAVDLSLSNPLFAQTVLSVASTIRGIQMDELGGEAVRQLRTTRRLAATMIATVAGLGVAAGVAAWVATSEAGRANERAAEVLRRESFRLAAASRAETAGGDATDGLTLALMALPQDFKARGGWRPWPTPAGPDRPITAEAAGALAEAVSLQREIRVLTPLDGDGDGRFMRSGFLDGGTRFFGFTRGGRLVVWSTAGGQPVVDVQGPSEHPKDFWIAKGGAQAVVADEDGTIALWEMRAKGTAISLPIRSPPRDDTQEQLQVVWSPSGPRLLVANPDDLVTFYDVPSCRVVMVFPFKGSDVTLTSSTKAEQSNVLSMRVRGRIERFDATDGRAIDEPVGKGLGWDVILRSRDGGVAIRRDGLGLGGVVVQKRAPDGSYYDVEPLEMSGRDQLFLSADGRWAAKVLPDGAVRVSNPVSRVREAWLSAGTPIDTAEFDDTGRRFLARLEGGSIALFAAAQQGWVDGYIATPAPGYSGLIAADGGSIAMGVLQRGANGLESAITVWDRETGDVIRRMRTGSWVRAVRMSKSGDAIGALLTGGSVQVWLRGETTSAWSGVSGIDGDGFVDLAFSGVAGDLIASTGSGTAVEFDYATGKERRRFPLGSDRVTSIATSPEGKWLVVTSLGQAASRGELARFEETRKLLAGTEEGARRGAATDSVVVVAGSDAIRAFDATTMRLLKSWPTNGLVINSLSFSNDGTRVAAATDSGTVLVLDPQEPSRDVVLQTGSVKIYSATFAPGGDAVLTTGHDGRARLWTIGKDVEELVTLARRRALRCISGGKARALGVVDAAKSMVGLNCASIEGQSPSDLD